MEKQKASNWHIAASYFFSSLVVASVVSVIWSFIEPILPVDMGIDILGMMLAAAAGAFYGARQINKKYFIVNAKKIVEFAGLYYTGAVVILGSIVGAMLSGVNGLKLIALSSPTNSMGYFLIALVIYQCASLWYIKSESEL
jgi:hypothetical protein